MVRTAMVVLSVVPTGTPAASAPYGCRTVIRTVRHPHPIGSPSQVLRIVSLF
jgi:hypothetical protein